jgi:sulfite reductase beta subunit-like hemoprotein
MTVVNEERRYSYLLTVGGHLGQKSGEVRLGEAVRKGITEDRVTPTVKALVDVVWQHRHDGESFQEVVARQGSGRLADLLNERLGPVKPEEAADTAHHEIRKVEMEVGGP